MPRSVEGDVNKALSGCAIRRAFFISEKPLPPAFPMPSARGLSGRGRTCAEIHCGHHYSPLEGESARQGRQPLARRWGVLVVTVARTTTHRPAPPLTLPMPSARPFSCAPKKKAEKEGRRSDAAGAAFPRIVPVVETEASALRTFEALLDDGAGRNRAEKPLPPAAKVEGRGA